MHIGLIGVWWLSIWVFNCYILTAYCRKPRAQPCCSNTVVLEWRRIVHSDNDVSASMSAATMFLVYMFPHYLVEMHGRTVECPISFLTQG